MVDIHFSILNSKFKHIFFDLDGTLTQSAPGIISSVRYSLEKFNIKDQTDQQLQRFIGPPLTVSYQDYYNFSLEDAFKAMWYYREYYAEKGIFENDLYDGISSMLKSLKEAGYKLYVATSKPEVYMKKIISHFKIDGFFDDVSGGDLEEKHNEKWMIIDTLIQRNNLQDAVKNGEVLMIGDRKHDILGARKFNIPCCGVLWGYGSLDEFNEYKADFIAETVSDLIK